MLLVNWTSIILSFLWNDRTRSCLSSKANIESCLISLTWHWVAANLSFSSKLIHFGFNWSYSWKKKLSKITNALQSIMIKHFMKIWQIWKRLVKHCNGWFFHNLSSSVMLLLYLLEKKCISSFEKNVE